MAAIDELIAKIDNQELRERIAGEVKKLQKQKKFGLVFENHQPESTLLYDVPVKRGSKVVLKDGDHNQVMYVQNVCGDEVICYVSGSIEAEKYPLKDVVCIAQFGEPIYPYLQPMATVENAPDSDLWHALIQADNYHALQLLAYLYPGMVDCIYIDPPYNTGARDWKYNNDYVDTSDSYRHSKWLSMMEKRLKIAKRLLNPKDSVLIVTIDEKEYLHLGCLLEEMFPEARIQMVSTVINPTGTQRPDALNRTDEYIYILRLGDCKISPIVLDTDAVEVDWRTFRRQGSDNLRPTRPNQFYPIYVEDKTKQIVRVGEAITPDIYRFSVPQMKGCTAVFPIKDDGTEMMWSTEPEETIRRLNKGYIRVGKYQPDKPQQYILQYLYSGKIKDIESGKATITGHSKDGSVIAYYMKGKEVMPTTQWNFPSHNAQTQGSSLIKKILTDSRFSFPKSLYAVHDTIRFFVANKPNALIVDFFAGSGTTLHAVNLLNAEDGGHRRCIMVTNNEVSDAEAKAMTKKGLKPGDDEWEKLGIAQYVTWPRTVCSIEGHDVNGNPLKGDYLSGDKDNPIHMADGFKANAAFYKLGFLDKDSVALGRQFNELLPLLWLKAGAKGECPKAVDVDNVPEMIISGNFAVLTDESYFPEFADEVNGNDKIEVAYIITDSDSGYREMSASLTTKRTYQLYKGYLDNFRINKNR